MPDILVKGGDYKISNIVGYNLVQKNNGEVISLPLMSGISTTNILNKIKNS